MYADADGRDARHQAAGSEDSAEQPQASEKWEDRWDDLLDEHEKEEATGRLAKQNAQFQSLRITNVNEMLFLSILGNFILGNPLRLNTKIY